MQLLFTDDKFESSVHTHELEIPGYSDLKAFQNKAWATSTLSIRLDTIEGGYRHAEKNL